MEIKWVANDVWSLRRVFRKRYDIVGRQQKLWLLALHIPFQSLAAVCAGTTCQSSNCRLSSAPGECPGEDTGVQGRTPLGFTRAVISPPVYGSWNHRMACKVFLSF